ncbi:acyl-CoA dehydrogenase [Tersicoccus phoenicis]|uniref:Dibenzothiophene monooxygenase n=1 Tax=Tersicoccus phoenicis TaxID=554083 RepID=A0A1R1L9H6_9MICC|nr:acyl-CoA dehydrogenase family protein [Tersicoccus phoenicis]OMH24169.1 acyl-CoA dehydrogenase [Tersicoccus phoenicis]
MTTTLPTDTAASTGSTPGGPDAEYERVHARFAPILARIAEDALARDQDRTLPHEPVRWLDEAGFGALRVPVEYGGAGVSVETVTRLLIDLAAADSNVAHLYRSHLGFTESLRWQPTPVRERWYGRIAAGQTVGNASTERGGNALGTLNTTLSRDADGGWRLNGTKYYTTGTIFSDHTRVSAALEGADGRRFAVVPVTADGVRVEDDWDGFGQKLTGTGTAVFTDVLVDDQDVLERVVGSAEAVHEAAFFQLVLLAVLAGIARAARDDAATIVAGRTRTFNTGSGQLFRDDPLIQQVVGRIAARAFAAEATVLAAARSLDRSLADAPAAVDVGGEPEPATRAQLVAEVDVEQAQVTVPELALAAAQQLFEASGASATSTRKGLDRHWRNAQTVATHNPAVFRARAIGDWFVNGTPPEGLNAIGDARPSS